jgi:hypothetical protein
VFEAVPTVGPNGDVGVQAEALEAGAAWGTLANRWSILPLGENVQRVEYFWPQSRFLHERTERCAYVLRA